MENIRSDKHYELFETQILKNKKFVVIVSHELNLYDLRDIFREIQGSSFKNKIIFRYTDKPNLNQPNEKTTKLPREAVHQRQIFETA